MTTTPIIEGKPASEYLGIVSGETIIGANIIKDFFAGVRDIIGSRSSSYESVLREAKESSLKEIEEKAIALGAIEQSIEIIDIEETPLAYAPDGAVRLRIKAAGSLDIDSINNTSA